MRRSQSSHSQGYVHPITSNPSVCWYSNSTPRPWPNIIDMPGGIVHDVWFLILHFRIGPRWPSIIWQTCRPTNGLVCLNVEASTHCTVSHLYRLTTSLSVAARRLYIEIVRGTAILLLWVSLASDAFWSELAAAYLLIRNLVLRAQWPGSRLVFSMVIPKELEGKRQGLIGW